MTKFIRFQITIPATSGLPEDAAVNTWHFRNDDAAVLDAPLATRVALRMFAFYNVWCTEYASYMNSAANVWKVYDLEDPKPRVPFGEGTLAISNPGTSSNDLPAEVAIVGSFRSEYESGVERSRRRGRVYLGPIQDQPSDRARPSSQIITKAHDAFAALKALQGTDDLWWCTYSPTQQAATSLNDAFKVVLAGYIDNSYDTQRRRGVAPTARTTF